MVNPPINIKALQQPDAYTHPATGFKIIETHLSWVILTGMFAYKIKKPVSFGFQDFTTLEKRKLYCEKEVALNQRLAPELYLGVYPITGTTERPTFKTEGEPIEYAIKMQQFEQHTLLSRLAEQNALSLSIIKNLALQIANFHQRAEICAASLPYGQPDDVILPIQDNFTVLKKLAISLPYQTMIDDIDKWVAGTFKKIYPLMLERKRQGWIRACHGDLHLGNMAQINEKTLIFDCIEFNERFRWTDVISDIGFLIMDLEHRSQFSLGYYFLNQYCENTHDYEGLALLRFYKCYRAMVRAKITALQLQMEPATKQKQALERDFDQYLDLAHRYTEPSNPMLIITFGLSGAGKSVASEELSTKQGAIRLRADTLRRTLFSSKEERYQDHATHVVYEKLFMQAKILLQAGYSVIIDATFLKRWQRSLFAALAEQLQLPFKILVLEAPLEILEQRIQAREALANDPSEATLAVLKLQMAAQEELSEDEKKYVWIN